jgi:hypothetical protein
VPRQRRFKVIGVVKRVRLGVKRTASAATGYVCQIPIAGFGRTTVAPEAVGLVRINQAVRKRIVRRSAPEQERAASVDHTESGEGKPALEASVMSKAAARGQLEERYAELLLRVHPDMEDRPEFVAEFADHLADFTGTWGRNFPQRPEAINQARRTLLQWIDENAADDEEPRVVAAYG